MGKWDKYKRKYKKEWEEDVFLKDWIASYPGDDYLAMCKICMSTMRPHYTDLLSHGKTKKHLKRITQHGRGASNPVTYVEVLDSTFASDTKALVMRRSDGSRSAGKHSKDINSKRSDYLEWNDYFMAVAFLSAQRSKDPSTQVGACIVNDENKIVGIGYNGMPISCSDDDLPWAREADNWLDTKYPYVCHAEMNAILNKNSASVKGCSIFVALFPCNECAKLIIQSGIKDIFYYSDKHGDTDSLKASKRMLEMAGIAYYQHIPKSRKIEIDFTTINQRGPQKLSF